MNYGKLVIATEIDTKRFDAQINDVQNELSDLNKRYEETKSMKPFEGQEEDLKILQIEIEKTTNKLAQLQKQQQKISLSKVKNIEFNQLQSGLKYSLQTGQIGKTMKGFDSEKLGYVATDFKDLQKGIKDVGDEAEKTGVRSSKSFDKFGKTIKKVGLRILGLSSIYAIVSRASSAYLSQDTELAQKLQSVWVGLGAFLEPVLNMMADVLSKAVGYLNVFITALTGTDYIANANAKALNKQAQAQHNLNNEVQNYDFDVVRTQQDSSSGGGVGGLSDNSLFKMPELNENIVKKLQDMAKWLRENKDLIEQVGVTLGVTFGAIAIANLLKNIGKLIGVGGSTTLASGLTGLAWLLGIIAVAWLGSLTIKGLIEAYNTAKKLKEEMQGAYDTVIAVNDAMQKNNNELGDLVTSENKSSNAIKNVTNYLRNQTNTLNNHFDSLDKNVIDLGIFKLKSKQVTEEQKKMIETMQTNINVYEKLYNTRQLDSQGIDDYIKALEVEREMMRSLGIDTSELDRKLYYLSTQRYDINVNANVQDNVTPYIDNLINRFNNSEIKIKASATGSVLAGLFSFDRPMAAGGIVTQPTRALIGEAGYPEAVVPMTQDYLSTLAGAIAQAGGTGGNGTVNVYLDGRLIQRQVNNKQRQVSFARNG